MSLERVLTIKIRIIKMSGRLGNCMARGRRYAPSGRQWGGGGESGRWLEGGEVPTRPARCGESVVPFGDV